LFWRPPPCCRWAARRAARVPSGNEFPAGADLVAGFFDTRPQPLPTCPAPPAIPHSARVPDMRWERLASTLATSAQKDRNKHAPPRTKLQDRRGNRAAAIAGK